MAQGGSRKKRKARQRTRAAGAAAEPGETAARPSPKVNGGAGSEAGGTMARGYSRSRKKDDAARAALKPLAPGERPGAVTAGAILAVGLALAELVALAIGYDPDEPEKLTRSAIVVPLLLLIGWGMWKGRYWAVLGMQTLLGITIVFSAVGAATARNLNAVLLVTAIMLPAGVLFFLLVKAMARIQMPPRPGSRPR